MAEPKDNEGFFRKVVRFVANPTTEWAELSSRQFEARDAELEKSELKAMVERKRRNDFVRKREFDMLRRLRREGLTPEQLAALGISSKLDDSEARPSENTTTRKDGGVKAKIDDIERQMVGEATQQRSAGRPSGFFDAPTTPSALAGRGVPGSTRQGGLDPLPSLRGAGPAPGGEDEDRLPALPPLPDPDAPAPAVAPVVMAPGLGPLAPATLDTHPAGELRPIQGLDVAVEVSEIVHDPELDEAVIAFANADFAQCERALQQLIGTGGARADHAETWLVLFDLYRATGQQQRFESLALDYAQRFGWSAPQWFSLPKLVADAAADESPRAARATVGDIGWVCPEVLDLDALSRLRSLTLQMPLPWVFDWTGVRTVEPEAAMQLSTLLRLWAGQALEMQWIGGDRLFTVLAEAAPTGVRDADPAFWLARLDALRLVNRVDQFDETAIDYCVTYEVSPPSWEPTRCTVRISGSGGSTRSPSLSLLSEVSTSFLESSLIDDPRGGQVASVELSGQLTGDISATLKRLQGELREASVVVVSCARLIRVDFIAAGDLLNWVLARRQEDRAVQFGDAHRLVALFFGAMGINEHAKVTVRRV